MNKEQLRAIIQKQWDKIVGAGPTGDEMAVEWITEAVFNAFCNYQEDMPDQPPTA